MWRFREAVIFLCRDMFKDGWRTTITLLNLIIFLCCYFCLAALAKAAYQFGRQDQQHNTLLVISKNVFNPGDSIIHENNFLPIREFEPGQVAAVSPLIYRLLRIDDYLIQVCGGRNQDFESVFGLRLSGGRWPKADNEVLIGDGAALLAHWKIGQTLSIYGEEFTVTGTVTVPGTRTSSVWLPLESAESLFNTQGVYQFAWVKIAAGVDADTVRASLQADPRLNTHYDVFFVDALYKQYAEALQDIKTISLVLAGFSLALVIFGVYGSVYLTLSERNREITILRAIGFSTNTIRGLLILRSLILIVIAFIVSWGISTALLARFDQLSPLTINTLPLPVVVEGNILGLGILLSLICGCIGVWIPTIKLRFSSVQETIQR
jgi:ABC-type lipoprotein release transport system permease subunit